MRHAATVRLASATAVLWALLPTPFLPGPADSAVAEPVERLLADVDTSALDRLADGLAGLRDVVPDATPWSGR